MLPERYVLCRFSRTGREASLYLFVLGQHRLCLYWALSIVISAAVLARRMTGLLLEVFPSRPQLMEDQDRQLNYFAPQLDSFLEEDHDVCR